MTLRLSEVEARVLGALVEKEITTPEYYPLSLNALVNACNQKSNREPVMTLSKEEVRTALRSLSDQALARSAGGDSRVAKFEHRLNDLYNFHRHEIAILCVLLLRGPQTPGELRTRAERMYTFADLEAVHSAINLLARREPPLVRVLPRQPGTKESRYMHLLSGDLAPGSTNEPEREVSHESVPPVGQASSSPSNVERLSRLESQVNTLTDQLKTLQEQFAAFQKQFQ
jgi:uncharacterized protein